ncbi:MAG: flagellar motor protein MotB [Ruminiclostridium sp.]|nr:flagellar motor protein MotB [Ruminiclostridium sp.]
MAKKKVKVIHTGVDEWMSTYSDMVTLLMCFFVLLYAASTPNETKFQYIFQSFNSQGKYVNPFVMEDTNDGTSKSDSDGNTDVPPASGSGTTESTVDQMGLPHNFDDLFAYLSSAAASSEFSDLVSVSQTSASRINIRFNNSLMFDGDSAVLKESGKKALKLMMPAIKATSDYIKTIKVQGHTAQGFSAVNDWDLSSARACSVLKYMDYQVIVPSEKYIAEGRAQYDPIQPNDTEEHRQENRRVELVITRNEIDTADTPIIEDMLLYDYGITNAQTDSIDRTGADGGVTDDTVQQIISGLDSKYSGTVISDGETDDDYMGPSFSIPVTEIPEDILQPEPEEETAAEEETEAAEEG